VPIFRLIGGGCLGLLYLLTATPVALALTALLALADSSHHLAIQQTEHGIQLVLHHDRVNSPTHRHGMVARALTLIAQRPVGAQPDHVIEFTARATSEQTPALAFGPTPDSLALEPFFQYETLPYPVRLNTASTVYPRPPPGIVGSLLNTRSTVLLI